MGEHQSKHRHRAGAGAALVALLALVLIAPLPARAAPGDPLFIFAPKPPPPQIPPLPAVPPTGYLNGPCGLAVDDQGRFWVSDHHHSAVDVFSPSVAFEGQPLEGTGSSGPHDGLAEDPCALAFDPSGSLYLNNYHRDVVRFEASLAGGTVLPGSEHATGVAAGPSSGEVFVDVRDHIEVYDSSGARTGQMAGASLHDGYGIAVSGFAATLGFLYVPDAATGTVKVYDPGVSSDDPVAEITGPPGGFTSLEDAAVAVDDVSGDVYVTDDRQPSYTESPLSTIHVFDAGGAYRGHLKYSVIGSSPTGIAVDNSSSPRHPSGTQGRVYVTSGNGHRAGVYAYPPGAALGGPTLPPTVPPPPLGGGEAFPTISIGAALAAGSAACEGDACQVLPSEPVDPTVTTLLSGRGNPKVHYRNYRHASRKRRKAKRKQRPEKRRGSRHRSSNSAAASASSLQPALGAADFSAQSGLTAPSAASPSSAAGPRASGLLGDPEGFGATAVADGGGPAIGAGSHPYELDFSVGLEAGEELRGLRIDMPSGLLLNPANGTGVLCADALFGTPRDSALDPDSRSGESCPDQSQVGTVQLEVPGGGGTRRFGLFSLPPEAGTVARFGASPFGQPLIFNTTLRSEGDGTHFSLEADDLLLLHLRELQITLWGSPWDATHDGERGDCLDETEPGFPWAKCSVGDPVSSKPLAFVSLPTQCGKPLAFTASILSWQSATDSAAVLNRAATGASEPLGGCAQLKFDFEPESLLSVKRASSASGYVFRFRNEDPGLTDPRSHTRAMVRGFTIELPEGVSINPSLGAGLGVCTRAQLSAESAINPQGAGCPNASRIGVFRVSLPFFRDTLRGSVYLAAPDDPATPTADAENPFDSMLALYLVAKSADRGILIRVPGRLTPDPSDGTLTASFDRLPQLPFSDLEVSLRAGQRAALVSPPRCGQAITKTTMSSWALGAPVDVAGTGSPIETGVEGGPCPDGDVPSYAPNVIAGGVNSNVGSYTPYYVRLSRKDGEQEITSYSLLLPKGITGKIAGIPFCAEAAIAAARARRGLAETADPSCPAASQVGHTYSGYGVGQALTYAPGRIYLAGPYQGSPLSLVTVNAATVGPFDLGTVVVRSAFDVDQRTAQLAIDAGASDRIPHIIDGIPLHLREVRIYMDRFQFTHNPSNCEPSSMVSRLTGSGATFSNPRDDSVAVVHRHFQLLNCLTLGFKPKLGLRLRGPSYRGAYPSLRATFVSRGARDSNLKRIEVETPHSLFLAQNHIRAVCTQLQFAAERCPAGSVYGKAVAKTSLFDQPLRGNVYLRSSDRRLPDLIADLRSGAVRIVVEGGIGPGKHGGIRTFFHDLPDAPIESFTMLLRGGRHSLLQNSTDICRNPPLATVSALGQNNIGARFSSVLRGQCRKARKGR
jgi:hypothetical protein